MKRIQVVISTFFFLASPFLNGGVFSQSEEILEEDDPSRFFLEKDWVRYKTNEPRPDSIKKLFINDILNFNPDEIKKFSGLTGLIIQDTPIPDLVFLKNHPNLIVLEVVSASLHSIAGIENCKKLEDIRLNNNFIRHIGPLKGLTSLRRVRLYDNDIDDIAPIAGHINLIHLDLGKNNISNIEPLRNMKELRVFSIYKCTRLKTIYPISGFTLLTDLNISFLELDDFSLALVRPLKKLKNLRIQGMVSSNIELRYLMNLPDLEQLTMGFNDSITCIDSLRNLTKLEYLDIHTNNVTSIAVVKNFPSLIKLVMYSNQVSDLNPLLNCQNLRSLFVFNNPIIDYSVLHNMKQLQYLHVSNKHFDSMKALQLRSALPTTKISFY